MACATLLSKLFPLCHSLFVGRSRITVVDGVQEDFGLQHRQECCDAFRIREMKGIITCHEIHHTVIDVLFCED